MYSPSLHRFAVLLVFLLAPLRLEAQSPSGQITGIVTDADTNTPLAGVNVLLEATTFGTSTDLDGAFLLDAIPPGAYTLRASFVGYDTYTASVTIQASETTRLDLALTSATSGLDEIVVEGRGTDLVGVAGAASQGRVGQAQLRVRPLLRVGEVLETIPGTIVTQHSGSGKANQFFLRGFNLDHGTDFSASLDGVPLNLPTHAHGQGYLDLGFLIPELIERVGFEKGPYRADGGDFSTAGHADIRIARSLDAGIAKAEVGTDAYYRGLFANAARVGGGDLLYAASGQYYDGPWVNPENAALASGILKYTRGDAARGFSITALGYHHDWNATDQVASRAVDGDVIARLGTLDPTDGGTTGRYTLAGSVWRGAPGAARTRATAYAAYYHLDLFSNFTYFLDDPVRGDQFEQADRRLYAGTTIEHERPMRLGVQSTNTVGAALRHDQIFGVGLFRTDDRERIGTVRDDEVAESSLGLYIENATAWTRFFRTTLGLRGDVYRFDVQSDLAANSGTETAFIASPKLGVVVGPWARTEGYLNLGMGFHSNDARGTTIRFDPVSGEAVDPVDPLVRTRGAEIGMRTTALPGLQSTTALWILGLDSELVFVGDAGGTEASDASTHVGVEWNNYYSLTESIDLTLDVALTRSRFSEGEADGERIENSVGRVISGGVYAQLPGGMVGSVQLRHFGPRPLTGDGTLFSDAVTLLNLKVGYRFESVAVALDVLNATNSDAADVSYFYPSRLDGEPANGVEDVHFHPVIPRNARLSATWRF